MKVHELIEVLQGMPLDADLVLEAERYGLPAPTYVESIHCRGRITAQPFEDVVILSSSVDASEERPL